VSAAVADAAAPSTNSASIPDASVGASIGMRSAMPFASAASKSIIHRIPGSTAAWSSAVASSFARGSGPTRAAARCSWPATAATGRPPECTIPTHRSGSSRACGAVRHAASWPSSTTRDVGELRWR